RAPETAPFRPFPYSRGAYTNPLARDDRTRLLPSCAWISIAEWHALRQPALKPCRCHQIERRGRRPASRSARDRFRVQHECNRLVVLHSRLLVIRTRAPRFLCRRSLSAPNLLLRVDLLPDSPRLSIVFPMVCHREMPIELFARARLHLHLSPPERSN